MLSAPFIRTAHAQEFSTANADAIVRTLSVGIGPRPMGSPAERRALEFAVENLRLSGCDTAFIMPITRTASVNTSSGIAVGIRKGRSGRIIVLGGHIDSAGPEIPGAIDNASGSAVVLEAARALGPDSMESTLLFALFGGEEQGLQGSRYFVGHFEAIDSVALMIQVDMANGFGTIALNPDTYGASAPAWLVRAAVEEFGNLGYAGLDYPAHFFSWNYAIENGTGSDHEPFLQAGIPAIDFTTDLADPIHTPEDSYSNFDPSGLKRSGDLVLRLIQRFDGGVPSRSTSTYWLYLVGSLPLIIPLWGVWLFLLGTVVFATLLLLRLRKVHISAITGDAGPTKKRRWPGLKLLLVSLIIVVPAWYSSNLIGLLKNDRYPWFGHPEHYYILALLASIFGILISLRLAGRLRVSRSPYVLYKRSFVMLTIWIGVAALVGVKIAVAPAVCLFLLSLSLSMTLRIPAAVIALISPLWMFRLVFSEADTLLFHFGAPKITGSLLAAVTVNGVWILLLTLLVWAWLPGFVAMVHLNRGSGRALAAIRSRRFLVITAGLFGIYTAYLVLVPSYDRPWYPNLNIQRTRDMTADTDTLQITSSEYLRGAELRFDGVDTLIGDNSLVVLSTRRVHTPDPWLRVGRELRVERSDSATSFEMTMRLMMLLRPYTLSVRYESSTGSPPPVSTPLRTRSTGSQNTITWYSFPDSALSIPVSFSVADGDTLREIIEATFDRLSAPVEVQYRYANRFERTIWREERLYHGGSASTSTGGGE